MSSAVRVVDPANRLQVAADHLMKASKQLRRFSDFGFGNQGDVAAMEVERFAHVIQSLSQTNGEGLGEPERASA